MRASLTSTRASPRSNDASATTRCPNAVPIARIAVLSRQVALPSRDRQLLREMVEQRVRDSEVAFAVLKVDRIHLVRHHRRAGLARNGLLREIADRDVAPHVAAEAEQDRVDANQHAEQLGNEIVAFDLSGERIPGQAEPLDEILRVRNPIDFGMREMMRVEISYRAVQLAEKFLPSKLRQLALRGASQKSPSPCRPSSATLPGRASAPASDVAL